MNTDKVAAQGLSLAAIVHLFMENAVTVLGVLATIAALSTQQLNFLAIYPVA